MLLRNMYLEKRKEFLQTGKKPYPENLLAMLLLSDKDKFLPLLVDCSKFYEYYQEQIDRAITRLEKDFNFTEQEIVEAILKKGVYVDDYNVDKIWVCYGEAIEVLQWSVLYVKNLTPEEIYTAYFAGGARQRKLVR